MANGVYPAAEVIEASDGVLYGTTINGGINNAGIVFKLNKDGTGFMVLHEFDGSDGSDPFADLVEGSDGALYGTTTVGGPQINGGVVFKVNKDGTGFMILHDFDGSHGAYPYAGLVEASDGAFYGTTYNGGPPRNDGGVVFRLTLGCEASLQVKGDIHPPGTTLAVQVHIAHHRPKMVTVPWELSLIDSSGRVILKHTTAPRLSVQRAPRKFLDIALR